MVKRHYHQKLPATGPAREAIREKGQFWTPDWVAEAMVTYAIFGGSDYVFDPAVGAGAFFRAAKTVATESGRTLSLRGTEIDRDALRQARQYGLSEADLSEVETRDFALRPPAGPFRAIIANPPYIRHHRLPSEVKAELKRFGARLIGAPLDGRAGLHIYFLLRALQLLAEDGRLAFIMPADTCEGIFAASLWNWITRHYLLEGVITFAPEASPFPGVDTNPVIFLIRKARPENHFLWVRCAEPYMSQLKEWIRSGFVTVGDTLEIYRRELMEGLATGLSRRPAEAQNGGSVLADFAYVMRGVATGANDFFFLTTQQADALGLPGKFLIPAVGRTRDVPGDEITDATIKALAEKGTPTLLFSPDGRPIDEFPLAVGAYLKYGESLKIDRRTLIATRRPWYKMEKRTAPPLLFAYLGRRHTRFVRNYAGVVPLTGFLCVYPRRQEAAFIDKLWGVLRHPETIANLSLVGKSYGSGAIKVEPRALEKLSLPPSLISESGLNIELAVSRRRNERQIVQLSLPIE